MPEHRASPFSPRLERLDRRVHVRRENDLVLFGEVEQQFGLERTCNASHQQPRRVQVSGNGSAHPRCACGARTAIEERRSQLERER